MNRNYRGRFIVPCVLFGTVAIGSGLLTPGRAAYVNGPPPATTGGFGEETCQKCHLDYPSNNSSGSLRIDGIPERYTPGERYQLTVRLTHPQLERGGFEMASRFAS